VVEKSGGKRKNEKNCDRNLDSLTDVLMDESENWPLIADWCSNIATGVRDDLRFSSLFSLADCQASSDASSQNKIYDLIRSFS
jgi:hypothetical protein